MIYLKGFLDGLLLCLVTWAAFQQFTTLPATGIVAVTALSALGSLILSLKPTSTS